MRQYLLISAIFCLTATAQTTQAPMVLKYDKPATYFEESLPIGNGKIGALVYGGTDDNIIYLNDITFWTGKPVDRNLDRSAKHFSTRTMPWPIPCSCMFKVLTRSISSHSARCISRIWA